MPTKLLFASSQDANMRYAIRGEVSDPCFYLETAQGAFLYLDHRELGIWQKQKSHIRPQDITPIFKKIPPTAQNKILTAARIILERHHLKKTKILVPDSFPLSLYLGLRKLGFNLEPTQNIFPQREKKRSWEIKKIKETVQATEKIFSLLEDILKDTTVKNGLLVFENEILTSERLKMLLRQEMLKLNLEDVEGMIIASGQDSAIPHHRGAGPIKANQPIVCDIFPRHNQHRYFADLTRTYIKGRPTPTLKKMYAATQGAQLAALKALRPGAEAKKIHQTVCQYLKNTGFTISAIRGFTHSTGHGFGLEVHERPYLGVHSTDILKPGHVFTIEPGLYYPRWGGVRLEIDVAITSRGIQMLSSLPQRWRF